MTMLAPTLQAYFTDRLIRQRRVSPHTIRAYRDTIRLLVTSRLSAGTSASKLAFDDLDSRMIGRFSTTSSTTAAAHHERGTPAWPRLLVLSLRRPAAPRCTDRTARVRALRREDRRRAARRGRARRDAREGTPRSVSRR